MWDYVVSRERHKELPQIGRLILPNGIVRIYRVKDDREEEKFADGVVCADLETVFELMEYIQYKVRKVREDG